MSKKKSKISAGREITDEETFTVFKKEKSARWAIAQDEMSLDALKNYDDKKIVEQAKLLKKLDKSSLAHFYMMHLIIKRLPIMTNYYTDGIYAYDENDKYYKLSGESQIKKILTDTFQNENTSHTSKEVLHLIRSKTYKDDAEILKARPITFIPFKNGIYDLENDKLINHDPKFCFDYQVPHIYDPNAKCEVFDKFIKEIVDQKDVSLVYDIFGLILYPKNILEKFFVFTGNGQNGKSKLITSMEIFCGSENYSSISLHQMSTDKFSVARMKGKLLNAGADISGSILYDTSLLKSVSGSDSVSGQFKFGQIFDFIPTATQVFSANVPPQFGEDSDGMYRRAELIYFPNEFGNDADIKENPAILKADPHIIEKITTEDQMSGLINIAIKHLKAIINQGQLSVVRSVKQLKKDYTKYSNSALAFLEANCIEAAYEPVDSLKGENIPAQNFLTVSELYLKYKDFCKENKLNCMVNHVFVKRLGSSGWNLEVGQQDWTDSKTTRHKSVRGLTWKT